MSNFEEPETKKAKFLSTPKTSPTKQQNKNQFSPALEQLKEFTTIVADTGEILSIEKYHPQDATTNPSLIFKAAGLKEYEHIVTDAIEYAIKNTTSNDSKSFKLDLAMDRLAVNFGSEISKLVPGYVSTEVDARLSFNTQATVERARRIIKMYEELGIDKSRILIKIASTFEGIRAGEILEKEGIHCNLTLLFSLVQAAACAEAGITLISPFVGRILDWYKAKTGQTYSAETDPGVISVIEIYEYMRYFHYKTIVMGASFRNIDEIIALAGCDRLTIAPALLAELQLSNRMVDQKLSVTKSMSRSSSFSLPASDNFYSSSSSSSNNTSHDIATYIANTNSHTSTNKNENPLDKNITTATTTTTNPPVALTKAPVDEASFRFTLNEDAMATEKLAEGIRQFSVDLRKLEHIVVKKLDEFMATSNAK